MNADRLVGRDSERAALSRFLDEVRQRRGASQVLFGEAGTGKSALLDALEADAAGMNVLRGLGIESEAEIGFAGLHLLLRRHTDLLPRLPSRQAEALRGAFRMTDDEVRDPFLVSAATLSLLVEIAAGEPLLCLVDDAQWLDRSTLQAMLFAARRLDDQPIGIVFAARADERGRSELLPGLPALHLTRLGAQDSERLLHHYARTLAGPTRAHILAEARGNPLAIIEMSSAIATRAAESPWAGGIGPIPVSGNVQAMFASRISALPHDTRRLLVVAAADDAATTSIAMTAARALGLDSAALEPAETQGLIELDGDRVSFRHPLIRSAAYQDAPRAELVRCHLALAEACAIFGDDDRRVWHLAAAAMGADEQTAVELERVASRSRRRGGIDEAGRALERAAELSGDSAAQARRLVGAARAAYETGRFDHAARCAQKASDVTGDPLIVAEALWVRGQVTYETDSPAGCARLILDAADILAPLDPERALIVLFDAAGSARDAGDTELLERTGSVLQKLAIPDDPDSRILAEGLGAYLRSRSRLVPADRDAMSALLDLIGRRPDVDPVVAVLGAVIGMIVGDDDRAARVSADLVATTRRDGSWAWLPYSLEPLSIAHLLLGRHEDAGHDIQEALTVAAELQHGTEGAILPAIAGWLAAVSGDHEGTTRYTAVTAAIAAEHPVSGGIADWARGLSHLVRLDFEPAAEALIAARSSRTRGDILIRTIPDLVEVLVPLGRIAEATDAVDELTAWARWCGTPRASALDERSRALLAVGPEVDDRYATALGLHELDPQSWDRGRTRLAYGMWLRRHRRGTEARHQLAGALDDFAGIGAAAWVARTASELRMLGEHPELPAPASTFAQRLTPQELQVARLAARGFSNREIAAQLFLSHRTVGHHLYRLYPKLGIARRSELHTIEL